MADAGAGDVCAHVDAVERHFGGLTPKALAKVARTTRFFAFLF